MQKNKTTIKELELILEEGEGYLIEFKESINSDLSKEMVAFANASGGRIFLGVSDQSRICGFSASNKDFSQIQSIADSCDPPVPISIEGIPEKKVVIIHVFEGANRPHRCSKGFYLRNGANSQKMSTADITEFVQAEGRIRFDEKLRLDFAWKAELAEERLLYFLKLAEITPKNDIENLLFNLGCGDYLEKGAQVMIEIFDNRVEISNPGGLPKGLNPKDFGRRSICRNPIIANLLLRCNYIEKMGTGIERIRASLAERGLAEAQVSFDSFFSIQFLRENAEKTGPESRPESRMLSDVAIRLLEALSENCSSKSKLASALARKSVSGDIKRLLKEMLEQNLVEMTIPDKPNSRLQKYRLTESGKAI